jgi:3',5'-cyclic AMP phosphodiesterase CpdA
MLFDDPSDTADGALQFTWLQQQLASAQAAGYKNIVIFQHIPYFLNSATEVDSYWNVPSAVRGQYLALLEQYGVRYVFAGHLHYNSSATDGIIHVLSYGPVGKPLGNGVSGMQLVQIQGTTFSEQYYSLTSMPSTLALSKPEDGGYNSYWGANRRVVGISESEK